MELSCSDICETVCCRLCELGFRITEDKNHSDIIDAIDQVTFVRNDCPNIIIEIENPDQFLGSVSEEMEDAVADTISRFGYNSKITSSITCNEINSKLHASIIKINASMYLKLHRSYEDAEREILDTIEEYFEIPGLSSVEDIFQADLPDDFFWQIFEIGDDLEGKHL